MPNISSLSSIVPASLPCILSIFTFAVALNWNQGLQIFASCMPIAIVGWISAIYQGKTSAASIQMISKKPEAMGKAIILPAMVETYAVLALLTSILMLMGVQL